MFSQKIRFKVWFNNAVLYRLGIVQHRKEAFWGNIGWPPARSEMISLVITEQEQLARLSCPDEIKGQH